MSSSKKLLIFLITTNLFGCASTKNEQGSILMEDVIVERTTVRSTRQNPPPAKGSVVNIQGDNINIGTLIVNSPNARVDNSTRVVQVQQNYQSSRNVRREFENQSHSDLRGPEPPANYHNDRDFFKNMDSTLMRIIPSLIMMR